MWVGCSQLVDVWGCCYIQLYSVHVQPLLAPFSSILSCGSETSSGTQQCGDKYWREREDGREKMEGDREGKESKTERKN